MAEAPDVARPTAGTGELARCPQLCHRFLDPRPQVSPGPRPGPPTPVVLHGAPPRPSVRPCLARPSLEDGCYRRPGGRTRSSAIDLVSPFVGAVWVAMSLEVATADELPQPSYLSVFGDRHYAEEFVANLPRKRGVPAFPTEPRHGHGPCQKYRVDSRIFSPYTQKEGRVRQTRGGADVQIERWMQS